MDPGLARERTALAWQRTALSILFGTLLLARLTIGRIGVIAIVMVAVSAPMAFWVYAESRRRYRSRCSADAPARPRKTNNGAAHTRFHVMPRDVALRRNRPGNPRCNCWDVAAGTVRGLCP